MNNLKRILGGLLIIVFLSASFCCHSMAGGEDRNVSSAESHNGTSERDPHACCPSTSKEDHKECHCRGELLVLQPETVKKQGGDELPKLKHFPINWVVGAVDDLGIFYSSSPQSHLIHIVTKPNPIYLVNRVLRL